MNKEIIRKIIYVLSVMLFGVMTATVAYNYASMECSIAHQGASAPASVAYFIAVPYIIAIAILLVIGRALKEKR